jgi:hypothetical protein
MPPTDSGEVHWYPQAPLSHSKPEEAADTVRDTITSEDTSRPLGAKTMAQAASGRWRLSSPYAGRPSTTAHRGMPRNDSGGPLVRFGLCGPNTRPVNRHPRSHHVREACEYASRAGGNRDVSQ